MSSEAALLLLFRSLVDSYFNVPVAGCRFGMTYVVPVLVDWSGTVIAVNIGGAIVAGLLAKKRGLGPRPPWHRLRGGDHPPSG
jgi:uncharacterized membrane protein